MIEKIKRKIATWLTPFVLEYGDRKALEEYQEKALDAVEVLLLHNDLVLQCGSVLEFVNRYKYVRDGSSPLYMTRGNLKLTIFKKQEC